MALFATYAPRDGASRSQLAAPTLRVAQSADRAALSRITRSRQGGPQRDHERSWTRRLAAASDGEERILVAELEQRLVGFGALSHFEATTHAESAPTGWYLTGVVVDPAWRRRGVAAHLTRARLEWIDQRADEAYYFANASNRATIDLHAVFGFVERTRAFHFPGVEFTGGVGILFHRRRAET